MKTKIDTKSYEQQIKEGAFIEGLLRAYLKKYKWREYIRLLISSYSDVRGDWSFNASKTSLSHVIDLAD